MQRPNVALLVWVGATVLRWLVRSAGDPTTALRVLASAALVFWAGDEILRGVNPWRRMLGAAVLVTLAASLG